MALFSSRCNKPKLHFSALFLSPRSHDPLFFHFRSILPIVPYYFSCSAFKHLCFPDVKQYERVTNLSIGLRPPDLFSTPTPPLLLPPLVNFPPQRSSKILAVALQPACPPVVLLTISFLAAFAIESQPFSNSFLVHDVL